MSQTRLAIIMGGSLLLQDLRFVFFYISVCTHMFPQTKLSKSLKMSAEVIEADQADIFFSKRSEG